MGLFVRMLEKQKWERLIELGHEKTPADTLQSELKTDSNNLSLWLAESNEELLEAVLALALARNKLTRLDILVLDQQEYKEMGFSTENTPENGLSAYNDFNNFHYDLIDLNYEKLGILSQMIIESVNNPDKVIRYNKGKIGDILYQGLMSQKFRIDELEGKLQEELRKLIEKKKKATN